MDFQVQTIRNQANQRPFKGFEVQTLCIQANQVPFKGYPSLNST